MERIKKGYEIFISSFITHYCFLNGKSAKRSEESFLKEKATNSNINNGLILKRLFAVFFPSPHQTGEKNFRFYFILFGHWFMGGMRTRGHVSLSQWRTNFLMRSDECKHYRWTLFVHSKLSWETRICWTSFQCKHILLTIVHKLTTD